MDMSLVIITHKRYFFSVKKPIWLEFNHLM